MKCLLVSLCVALLGGFALAAEPKQFTRLFDGKTFDGWEGNLKVFRRILKNVRMRGQGTF